MRGGVCDSGKSGLDPVPNAEGQLEALAPKKRTCAWMPTATNNQNPSSPRRASGAQMKRPNTESGRSSVSAKGPPKKKKRTSTPSSPPAARTQICIPTGTRHIYPCMRASHASKNLHTGTYHRLTLAISRQHGCSHSLRLPDFLTYLFLTVCLQQLVAWCNLMNQSTSYTR